MPYIYYIYMIIVGLPPCHLVSSAKGFPNPVMQDPQRHEPWLGISSNFFTQNGGISVTSLG